MLEAAVSGALDRGSCPHLAVLLRSRSELHQVLASFYALGARRKGWLVHRALPGEETRDRELLAAAGLDVAALEDEGRLVVAEFDFAEAPEDSTDAWEQGLDDALGRGFASLWYSRFAIGPEDDQYEGVLAYERQWEASFHGRPVVTLCPYVVEGLEATKALGRLDTLSEIHDGVLTPAAAEEYKLLGRL